MARQSKYLIALSKQIELHKAALEGIVADREVAIAKLAGKVEALEQLRQTLEKLGHPKKKAAPLKAVTAAQA